MKISRTRRIAMATMLALNLIGAVHPAIALIDADPEDDGGLGGGGGGGGSNVPTYPVYQFPETGFTWRAPSRAGAWQSNWAEYGSSRPWPQDTYNPEYVNPTSWDLYFQGCQTKQDYDYDLDNTKGKGVNQYRWKWDKRVKDWSSDCYTTLDFPAQGTYYVEMSWKGADNVEHSVTLPVRVKDYLIVQLGDSMAAGEGAPDKPIHVWDTTANADWVDDRCHRSKYAGAAVAAQALENLDPHSSVTFLSFACSGATLIYDQPNGTSPIDPYIITDYASKGVGLTAPFVGIEPPLDSNDNWVNHLPAQTDQLYAALSRFGTKTPRVVDVLLATGGINDVRFASLTKTCVLSTLCPIEGVGFSLTPLAAQFEIDRQNVEPGWDLLKEQLHDLGIVSRKRLALEYPPLFHDDEGDTCLALFWDIIPGLLWTVEESAFAHDVWAPHLNQSVKAGATANTHGNQFEWVGGIAADFDHHGMCADDNWFNTPTESAHRQGDEDGNPGETAVLSTTGLAHPNAEGYEHIAARILDHTGNIGFNEPPAGGGDKIIAGKNVITYFNVIGNDSDPDGDFLMTRRLSQPLHGYVNMKPDGRVSYRPHAGFTGTDYFAYELTDGEYAVPVFVTVSVEEPVKLEAHMVPGEVLEIGGLGGPHGLEGPFEVVFDKLPKPNRGTVYQEEPEQDVVTFDAATLRRRGRFRLPYVIYDRTPNVTSPTYGTAVRGMLLVKIRP